MTKKTRIRVARIAAGAVIAAGASLTITGAAQAAGFIGVDADDSSATVQTGFTNEEPPNQGGEEPEPPNPGGEEPEPPNPGGEEPESPDPGGEEPESPDPGGEEPESPDPGGEEPESPKPTTPPTTDPTKPTAPPAHTTEPSDPGSSGRPPAGGNAGGHGGGDNCTVDANGAACADNTDTDSVGNQPVEQGKGKDELAETGAAETTFLLVGAATMIAGGIGFRILPRLAGGSRTAV
ncbi:hypothetical protein OG909_10895 [Streptomyces sp. NBC_01754]|uniref:LPXTG cell wall anchor domain-containing protein n=1 Tax=Streptomyces sp. NBC_01754 TaxID=2975930 RepID=UPI002DD97BEA|nr:hypothetical protein [Streptomyces sp. NBC_01754]WSC92757.1 hypothetical protein OG909_10895 [Streptomyces sp. NBC_01754]